MSLSPKHIFRPGDNVLMKNLAAIGLMLVTLGFSALGQTSTATRPRVAPTPTPPKIVNDPYENPAPSGPPVLIGATKPGATPTPVPLGDDGEVIKVETNLVTMPVSVLDRDGRFISGLQKGDFKIFEDGVEQKVDYFQSVEQPFTVVIMIDVSPSTAFKIEEIQNAAMTFVDQLRPADRVMVVSFDEHVHVLTAPTNNRYELKNAIRNAQFGDGTSLYEAVDYVINDQLRQVQGRKAVVLFTDGVDTTSKRASYNSTLSETEEVDALFYTIRYDTSGDMNGGGGWGRGGRQQQNPCGTSVLAAILCGGNVSVGRGGGGGGRRGGGNEYETGRKYLEGLASTSGGREFEAQSIYNVDSAFSGIAEELRRQYSLGYYPDKPGTLGERKQIKIRVLRPEVVVRAKNTYVVGQTNRNIAGK